MTDEEKAEEYIISRYKLNKCYFEDTEETRVYMHNDVHSEYEEEYQLYLAGLTEGGSKYDEKLIKFLSDEKIEATLFINSRWTESQLPEKRSLRQQIPKTNETGTN